MRGILIALFGAIALAACASAPPSTTRAAGGWAWQYDPATGLATAQQTSAEGRVTVRVSCQAPSGDLTISDYVLGAGGRGSEQVQFRIGNESITVDGRNEGGATVIRMPRRPPNLQAYAHLSRDAVTLTAGSRSHTYAADAIEKIALVANSCWPVGS
ncbi:MAG: hypothetical protein AB7T08_09110 [Hyphomonadaceae bacterium]